MTSLNINMSRFLELFKNLKSDAVPRAPRPAQETNSENTDQPEIHIEVEDEEEEEIVIEPEEDVKKKPKKKFFKSKKKYVEEEDDEDVKPSKEKRDSNSSVNVQATGNVYNIVNSSGVRLGNDYYFGSVSNSPSQNKSGKDKKYEEEEIEKDNFIRLLMEANIKPDHDYMDYISKNLGKNWHTVFRSLGFTQGRIETAEINAAGYDISEARYKLLLDWVNNDDDGSLGRLATLLWEEGERSIVKELSLIYKKSKK